MTLANKVDKTNNTDNSKLSSWYRLRQYQPTNQLVKVGLLLWLFLLFSSLIKRTEDIGIISSIANYSYYFTLFFIILFFVILIVDVLVLKVISNKNNYQIERKYPKNISIFHELDIEVIVQFLSSKLPAVVLSILKLISKNKIYIDFTDDYPNQLKLVDDKQIQRLIFDFTYLYVDKSCVEKQKSSQQTTNKERLSEKSNNEACLKKLTYTVLPIERGTSYFGKGYFRVISPFALFHRKFSLAEVVITEVEKLAIKNKKDLLLDDLLEKNLDTKYIRVLSDFSGLLTNDLSAVFEKSFDAGSQTIKSQGQGSEFLNLREYSIGDSMRQIDWKASSRQGRIMSKSYEDENDQDIIFLLDCGEQMRHKEQNDGILESDRELSEDYHLNYFDKVLNSVLLLSHIANKQGDRVGLMTFGSAENESGDEMFIAPQKGVSLIRTLLNETADLKPTMYTSDYYKAAENLLKSIKKRSLVVVITNTRQEASDELVQAIKRLSKYHQVVFANLTEQYLQNIIDMQTIPNNIDDALLYHSVVSYNDTRNRLHKLLTKQTGATCLATTANKLPIKLTETYFRVTK